MDSDAQDSILALQALLNFKRCAQVVSESHQSNNPNTAIARDNIIRGVKVKKTPKRLSQQSTKPRKLPDVDNSVQALKNENITGNNGSMTNTVSIPLSHPRQKIPCLAFEPSLTSQSPIPPPLTSSLGLNPYILKSSHTEKYQVPKNSKIPAKTTKSELGIENRISLLSSQQVARIPHAFSSPVAYVALKQDDRKLVAQNLHVAPMVKTNALVTNSHPGEIANNQSIEVKSERSEQSFIIRPEEVQAALRSKPQRGKKRDNLSVLERMELTRTRNREHAKCTRARKKMRLEQLEANELKFLEMQKKENLLNARRECVSQFLKLRTENLSRNKKTISTPESTWQFSLGPLGNDGDANESEIPRQHRTSSISELSIDNTAVNDRSALKTECNKEIFQGIVKDFSSFKFVFQHGNIFSSQGLENLLIHEEKILDYMKRSHGNSDDCGIAYNVVGGTKEVSLGGTNNGFAFIDIILNISREQKITYNGFIEFQFEAGSHELIYFKHHEFLTKPLPDSDSSSSSSLSQQVTFPSVVSLDVPSQGRVLSRIDMNVYDTGARQEKASNIREDVSHLRQGQVNGDQLSGMGYQTEDNQNPVGMDI